MTARQSPTEGLGWQSRIRADVLLLMAAVLWGVGNVPQKLILEDLGPMTTTGLRCAIAALVVLPLGWREARRTRAFSVRDWPLILGAALSFALAISLTQIAFGGTTATNTGFLINTSTVIVPIVAWLAFRQRLSPIGLVAAVVTMTGACLMCGGSIAAIGWGDGLALAAALFFALWIVLLSVLVQRTGRPRLLTALQLVVTAVLALPVGLAFETLTWDRLVHAMPLLLFISVFSLAIGWTLCGIALQRTPPADAAVIQASESVFGALAASLILGEQLGERGMLGAVLIIAGILIVELVPVIGRERATLSLSDRLSELGVAYVMRRGAPPKSRVFGLAGGGISRLRRRGQRLDVDAKIRIVRTAALAVEGSGGKPEQVERLCDVIVALKLTYAEAMAAIRNVTAIPPADVQTSRDCGHRVAAE